jgi:hypothetical protein
VPLSSGTLVPLEFIAETVTGTENETILVAGASVPTTKAGPVSAAGVEEVIEPVTELVQPATSNAAAVNEVNTMGKDLKNVLESIKFAPLRICRSGLLRGRTPRRIAISLRTRKGAEAAKLAGPH